MSTPRTRIATQVALIASVIFLAGITAFSLLSYWRASESLGRRWQDDLTARVALLSGQFGMLDATAKSNAERLTAVFESLLGGPVRVDTSRQMQVAGHAAAVVMAGGTVLDLDFTAVDAFSRMTGGVATVFVREGEDFLRVTTSLKKEDGNRALGTLLGRQHPAYDAVAKGRPYVGRADLFGRRYMAKYQPVVDGSGATVAILFVGFDITEAVEHLDREVREARIGQGGRYWVLDASGGKTRGQLIVHAQAQGRNVLTDAGHEAYRTVLERGEGSLVADGQVHVFRTFGPWHRIVGASIPADELHADAAALRNVLLLLGLAVLAVGCSATYLVLRRKLRPLSDLARDADRLGGGDLTVRVAVTTHDEVGELAGAFNAMAERISGIVARLKEVAAGVQGAVQEVETGSRHVEEASSSQSEAASRVAAALEQVTSSLASVAQNAHDSQHLSKRTHDLSEKGETLALRAADVTVEVAQAVRDAAGSIAQLSARSGQIREVVKVIRDIADQTNLLALNAAIEAARAGEQGRGFAVVADEVRKLAERTGQATVEIGEMIQAIQQETEAAVGGMGTGSQQVETGVTHVREAADALKAIRAAAQESLGKATEISRAMDEQSAAGTEISTNVERIAAMAEESNSAASSNHRIVERLEAMVRELNALTAGLKVG